MNASASGRDQGQRCSAVTSAYTYDSDGRRTKKTVGSTVYNYRYAGSQLVSQSNGIDDMHFIYDENGRVQSCYVINDEWEDENNGLGAKFYYVYNAQGDVVQLRDVSNAVVATITTMRGVNF